MDDLISRKTLYEHMATLEELAIDRLLGTPSSCPSYSRYNAQLSEITSLKHLVADVPTAYDVDKAIEQIKENTKEKCACKLECENCFIKDACGILEAIEIVKGAVKDE